MELRADPDQLRQLLLNLIKNALQASPPEGGKVTVSASVEARGLAITVEDNGHGIPAEVKKQVLTPWFTTRSEGSGLGLAICANIARCHGATLEIGDAPGGGTRAQTVFALT